MAIFLLRRLVSAALTILVVSALTFSLAFLSGDPAIAVAGKDSSDIPQVACRLTSRSPDFAS